MTLEQLKSELTEKEKGCGLYIGENRIGNLLCGKNYWLNGQYAFQFCPTCQAEISALKKGISTCEEILNQSQQKKTCGDTPTQQQECRGTNPEEGKVSKENDTTYSADTYIQTNGSLDCCSKAEIEENKKNFLICSICNNTGFLCPRTKEQRKDYEEGYNQSLSQRNKEILEIIEKTIKYHLGYFQDEYLVYGEKIPYEKAEERLVRIKDELFKQLTTSEAKE
jgi:hypothetical protein